MDKNHALSVFEGDLPRRLWHNEEWWFSVVDIIQILTESSQPSRYWTELKIKLKEEGSQLFDFTEQLKLLSSDNKKYLTDCVNMEGAFRLIQSIPSPKAEPFKLWLAKVGYDRVKEIENPELMTKRQAEIYKQKGYSNDWTEKRLRGIAIRQELTSEWKNREIEENKEFAILTNEISKATFGKTIEEYKKFKGLNKENLRDHMNDLELIFNMLGEKVTTEITKKDDADNFDKCKTASVKGGTIAGNARKETEKELGRTLVSEKNYLSEPEISKRKQIRKQ